MRTRTHDWFDTRTHKRQYGFQVFHNGTWRNAAENGAPCLFDTQEDRDLKQAEFRKMRMSSNKLIRTC